MLDLRVYKRHKLKSVCTAHHGRSFFRLLVPIGDGYFPPVAGCVMPSSLQPENLKGFCWFEQSRAFLYAPSSVSRPA